jgi:hypothetical protein
VNVHDTARAFLGRTNLHFLRSEEEGELVVPIPTDDSGHLLVHIRPDEGDQEVLIYAAVGRVPKGKAEPAALALAEINSRSLGIVWSMRDGVVVADVHLELDLATDPEACIARAFFRLAAAITKERGRVLAGCRQDRSRGRPRVLREVEEIVSKLGE